MSFLSEIRRRKVFQVAAVYGVVAWLIMQVMDVVAEPLSLPGWVGTVVIVLLMAAFPVALVLAWALELTPHGLVRTPPSNDRRDERPTTHEQPAPNGGPERQVSTAPVMDQASAKPKLMRFGPALEDGFKLEDLEIRPLEGKVFALDEERHLHPKVMEVLLCLAEKAGQVVQRDEILNQVWGHRYGSDKSLTRCISELRRALENRSGDSGLIETIPKRGYRLLASEEVSEEAGSFMSSPHEAIRKPSIAVLPFANMSGDREQEYFSDGITEDIITELSRIPGLFVIARNSTFAFKGKPETIQHVSRELGARYLLEGSVRKAGNRIRVNAQLVDGRDGGHIWAERYDRDLKDIFAVQDDLTRQIVSILAVTLAAAPEGQGARRAPKSLEAYEYILRGRELAWLHKRGTGAEAARLLARAIWLDPSYAVAYSWLAFTHLIDYVNQWSEQPDESLRTADELANKAVKLDDRDAQAHFVLGECRLWEGREHDRAIDHGRRAIELQPNYSHAYLLLGHALHYAGRSQESIEPYEAAMRLDPCYPDLYLHFLAQSYYSLGRYQDAIEALQERLTRNPDTDISYALLAACYGRLGQVAEAESSWERALSINSGYSLEEKRRVLPYKNPADFDDFADGLRAANLVH